MDLPVANEPRPIEKPPASSRFQFTSGDRPLSGYTIKRGVGRGGFGEVYFAVSDGGKEVALKLIRRNLDVELRGVQHCLNLKHPNLIALYDVRRDGTDDDCWIVMEYIAGESLEAAIRRCPQGMPADEAIEWLRGIAAGASYLHSHGIVHRDLKPGNVFREENLVKIGDYGLSKFISCSRRSGQTESVGTVHYMAPEISHGRYGREIDIYALGVILYEMLTGRVPFDGESVGEVLMKHLTAEPDVSILPSAYRAVVARALAKDPAVRFGSVEQFMAALPGAARNPAVSTSDLLEAVLASPAEEASAAAADKPTVYHDSASADEPPPLPPWPWSSQVKSPWPVRLAVGALILLVALFPTAIAARASISNPANVANGGITAIVWLFVIGGLGLYVASGASEKQATSRKPNDSARPAASDGPPPLPTSAAPKSRWAELLSGWSPGAIGMMVGLLFLVAAPPVTQAFVFNFVGMHAVPLPYPTWMGLACAFGLAAGLLAKANAGQSSAGQHAYIPRSLVDRFLSLPRPAVVLILVALGLFLTQGQRRLGLLQSPAPIIVLGVAIYLILKQRAPQVLGLPQTAPSTSPPPQPPPRPSAAPRSPSLSDIAYASGRALLAMTGQESPAEAIQSLRERWIELLQSLLVSAAVATVLAVIVSACQRGASGVEIIAWYALTGTLGAWSILTLSKVWEKSAGEPILRRFVMLAVGLGVGAASFGFDRLLMVRLPFQQSIRPSQLHVNWSFYNTLDGAPHLEAYLAYFALMFFLVPWWRQADPRRHLQLNPISSVWAVIVAILVTLICPFPLPWGAIVAAIISLSVQLASPRTPRVRRATTAR